MHLKYPRIYRIPHPSGYRHRGKRYLGWKELAELFNGLVYVEEKLDGSQFSIVKENGEILVYSRGGNIVDRHEPPAYDGIWNWVYAHYASLIELPEHYVLYGEWLRVKHTVYYDLLPDWAVIFDVYDSFKGGFLGFEEKLKVIKVLGLVAPPLVRTLSARCRSKIDLKRVIRELAECAEGRSAFSSAARSMEGVVVKNYDMGIFAKLINPWFDREVEEHELFKGGITYNSLSKKK